MLWDHPRIRGKDVLLCSYFLTVQGSPPHTRERLLSSKISKIPPRITPAYAGKTTISAMSSCITRDHPRIRGKDNKKEAEHAINLGSPPHTRERHKWLHEWPSKVRITPAYAGKTFLHGSFFSLLQDHPRIRGKDHCSRQVAFLDIGSPPHTRERPERGCDCLVHVRITPAYAGKTFLAWRQSFDCQDHPRIRGKDATMNTILIKCAGSPPHTRERLKWLDKGGYKFRITPAYAGKTFSIKIKQQRI